MNTFEYLKYKTEYPEKWNELTKKQLLFVAALMHRKLDRKVVETLILQKFTCVPLRKFYDIPALALSDMAETIAFLFDKKELTVNLLPVIILKENRKKVSLHGPDDGLLDLTFEQFFGYSETYFSRFAESGAYEQLNNLVCSLYVREKGIFNPDMFDNNLKLVRKMPSAYKFSILLFYLGCRDLMSNKFPELFRTKKTKSVVSDFHYFELIDQLSNENITNNNQIKQSNVYEAFVRLTAMIKKAEQIKKQ